MNRYPINPDRLELLSIQERAERRLLPDELLLKDIGLLIYSDKPDRISFYHDVLKACHENRINYTGDIDNDNWKVDYALLDFTEKPDEHLDYFEKSKRTEDKRNLFIKQAEIDIYSVSLPPSCYLHRDEIKDYFQSIKLWPITDCLLANWFEGEQLPEAVEDVGLVSNAGTAATAIQPRKGGYTERNELAIKFVKENPELLTMRKAHIKTFLETKNSLFVQGFPDWWRQNTIFPKGKAGRIPK